EVDMHEAGHEAARVGVLVVLDALEERVGAVADADDRDANTILRARGLSVARGHGVLSEPLGERLDDEVVEVSLALRGAGAQLLLQLRWHAQEDGASFA